MPLLKTELNRPREFLQDFLRFFACLIFALDKISCRTRLPSSGTKVSARGDTKEGKFKRCLLSSLDTPLAICGACRSECYVRVLCLFLGGELKSSRAMDFASLEGRCFSYLERWMGNLLPMEKAFLYLSSRLFCKLNWRSSFKPIANLGAIKVALGVKASVSFASSLKSRCESLVALRMTFIFLMLFNSSVFLPLIANGSSKCAMVPLPPPMPSNPGQWQPFKVDWCSISSASLTNCYSLSSLASTSLIVFISRSAGLRLELLSALSSYVGDGDLAPLSCCLSSSCMISLPVRFGPISRPYRLSLA